MIKHHTKTGLVSQVKSWAVFSPCKAYRYVLARMWDENKLPALFVMLNPSTADEFHNDPTVERCERRARALGYGGFMVCNLFAYRNTDRGVLLSLDSPVGSENDAYIAATVVKAGIVVCGWGTWGKLHDRDQQVLGIIRQCGWVPHYLELNSDGTPQHPLYVAYSKQPTPWIPRRRRISLNHKGALL